LLPEEKSANLPVPDGAWADTIASRLTPNLFHGLVVQLSDFLESLTKFMPKIDGIKISGIVNILVMR
jgi:hypothetical protein